MTSEQEAFEACAAAYVFNIVVIADREDQGGIDYPLESKYAKLAPLVQNLIDNKIVGVEEYDEDGEKGSELVVGENGEKHLNELMQRSAHYVKAACEGPELLVKAFFSAMHNGELNRIPEKGKPWYEMLFDRSFYESLAPSLFAENKAPNLTSQPLRPPLEPMEVDTGVGQSAIEINEYQAPVELPSKTYLYKKPSYYWGGAAVLSMLISNSFNSSLFWYGALGMAAMAVNFAFKKVHVSSDGVELRTLFQRTHIALDDIDETLLTEEEGELSQLQITGSKGDSLVLSRWIDDLQGAQHLLKKLKAEHHS